MDTALAGFGFIMAVASFFFGLIVFVMYCTAYVRIRHIRDEAQKQTKLLEQLVAASRSQSAPVSLSYQERANLVGDDRGT